MMSAYRMRGSVIVSISSHSKGRRLVIKVTTAGGQALAPETASGDITAAHSTSRYCNLLPKKRHLLIITHDALRLEGDQDISVRQS